MDTVDSTKETELGNGSSQSNGFSQAASFPFVSSYGHSCGISAAPMQSSSSTLFSNFVQNSHERFNQLLEERGFTHIPPPAGFGTPTRPASLLKDIWLNDASRVRSPPKLSASVECSPSKSTEQAKSNRESWNSEFPVSPLSPPSPFQHPFIKRQMGFTSDPWARFSGFGIPHLTPLIQHQKDFQNYNWRLQQTHDLHQRKSDSNILSGRVIKIRHSGSADDIDAVNGDHFMEGEEPDEVLVVEHSSKSKVSSNSKAKTNTGGTRKDGQYKVTSCRRFNSKNQSYK